MGHIGAKYAEEGVDRCKPNFNAIWESYSCYTVTSVLVVDSVEQFSSRRNEEGTRQLRSNTGRREFHMNGPKTVRTVSICPCNLEQPDHREQMSEGGG